METSVAGGCRSIEQVLSPELILRIAENVIQNSPMAVRSLMLTSRHMHSLLKAYETSISQSVSRSCAPDLLWGTGKLSILTYPFTATRHTYQWLDELNSRENSINYLINHELSDMLSPIHNWPSLDLPKNELSSLLQIFKRRALVLLYALADSAAGRPYALATTRKRQADFLESLSIKDLAAIGCIIEVMGQGYWNIIKKGLAELEYKDSLLGLRKSQRPPNLFIPRSVKNTGDLDSDYWIRECMCMFEDRIQHHGPTYAWAFFAGRTEPRRRLDAWARDELEVALEDLDAYERGLTMGYASLQSVVWAVFCYKIGCDRVDQWIYAKRIIEMELESYKVTASVKA